MSIAFQCVKCGKKYETGDETAGKAARCKQCGHIMTIPRPTAAQASARADLYGLDEPAPLPPRSAAGYDDMPDPPRPRAPKASAKSKSSSSGAAVGTTVGGVITAILVMAWIGLRVHQAVRNFPPANNNPRAVNVTPQSQAAAFQALAGDRNGPIAVPPLPDVGPGRELEPGVMFHEVHLPGGDKPGFSGKLWLYLPSGDHPPRSLPCVMITGAGSNLLTGMDLGDGDRSEQLPYVRAGFAVLAYELDGALKNHDNPSNLEMGEAILKFLSARAGLVNAHIALEFLLKKVPQVDPERIYTAGHSSAGTMAMLFAEHEPRLKGCVAFAPAIDLEKRFGADAVQKFRTAGFVDLAVRYAPKTNEAKLSCPLFLFHARDDTNVPLADTEASAERLRQLGKDVTFDVVPNGGHYNSMIRQGIPHAIAWLQDRAGMPRTAVPSEAIGADNGQQQQPQPPPQAAPFPRRRPTMPPSPGRAPRMGPRRGRIPR